MLKEIGSNFWINRNDFYFGKKDITLDYLSVNISDLTFLSTGRSAISYVLDHIQIQDNKRVALLPPFTCDTVIEPFIDAGYQVHYYKIDKNLICSENDLETAIEKYRPTVLLVHGYFGFNTLEQIKTTIYKIKKFTEITVIEDITQTIYSSIEHIEADYYISSLRKWTSLPDGAMAISAKKPFLYKPQKMDGNLLESKLKAFHEKFLYMEKNEGKKDIFLELYEKAEQILCSQNTIFSMNSISKLIQANLDLEFLRTKRRENFTLLNELLEGLDFIQPLFNDLQLNVTPLYFPIYVKGDRRDLQVYLSEHKIYAPVVWPKPIQVESLFVDDDVQWIYDHILAIPCDQRYSKEEMNYIADKIKNFTLNKVK